ncbi:MAG: hypothetical protein WKF57_04945 [Nakamurella sp.]
MSNLNAGNDLSAGSEQLTTAFDGAQQLRIRLVRTGGSLNWTMSSAHHPERADGVAQASGPNPLLDAEVIGAVRAGRGGDAPMGRAVVRPGPACVPDAPLMVGGSRPLPTDGSSNHVSLVTIDGVDYVHKRYRACSTGPARESEALRVLGGSRTAPELWAEYAYHDPGGDRWPLGLLYRYVPGVGLDVPLRADLRSQLVAALDTGPILLGHTTTGLLRASGALARSVHELLAAAASNLIGRRQQMAAAPRFDVATVLAQAGADLESVLQRLDALPKWARSVVPASKACLRAELVAIDESAIGEVRAGPCHGDLHLGQVVVGDTQDPGSVRLIDLSPLSLRSTDADYPRQTPWQDLVSFQRALEYFTTQEAHRQVSVVTGLDEDEVSTAAAMGSPLPSPALTQLRRVEERVAEWRAEAMAAVLTGYGEQAVGRSDPLYRLLYLVRLLHEFRYDLDHGRHGFIIQNLRHARVFLGQPVNRKGHASQSSPRVDLPDTLSGSVVNM